MQNVSISFSPEGSRFVIFSWETGSMGASCTFSWKKVQLAPMPGDRLEVHI